MTKRPGQNHYEKHPRDHYPTPRESVAHLVPWLKRLGVREFAEPCAGEGHLVRNLEAFGFRCVYEGDIHTGQDALALNGLQAVGITNLPFSKESKKLMMALLWHLIAIAPSLWVIFPSDFTHQKGMRKVLLHCTHIVSAGRACWFRSPGGSGGFDYVVWCRFDRNHLAGPQHFNGMALIGAKPTKLCHCGRSFQPQRSTAKFCSDACRQSAYRARLSATLA